MKRVAGIGASSGCAIGRAVLYRPGQGRVERRNTADWEAELARFDRACLDCRAELDVLYDQALRDVDQQSADIFTVYGALLEDQTLRDRLERRMREEQVNVEYALEQEKRELCASFQAIDDDYMRERGADVENVCRDLLRCLSFGSEYPVEVLIPESNSVLVAENLNPAQVVRLDRKRVCGIVLEGGSVHSHAAILARSMGIPAVVCAAHILEEVREGQSIALDGGEGRVVVEPDEAVCRQFRASSLESMEQMRHYRSMANRRVITQDGRAILVSASLTGGEELLDADWEGFDGVTPFRGESLYLGRSSYPTEEEQYQCYRTLAEKMENRAAVVAALDVGGEKQAPYLDIPRERNPVLGMQAVRFCLERPELFRVQLRAVLRASAHGRLRLALPMVSRVDEVLRARELLSQEMERLEREGIPFDARMRLGVLIETPAAVMISGRLARACDFLLIGVNNLVQYVLATDRANPQVAELYDPCNTAVLRCIAMTIRSAREEGVPVSLCGEAAGDERLLPLWAGLQVDELGVPPQRVPWVKHRLQEIDTRRAQEALTPVFSSATLRETEKRLEAFRVG